MQAYLDLIIPEFQEPRQQSLGDLVDILQCEVRRPVLEQYHSGILLCAEGFAEPNYAGVAVGFPAFCSAAPNAVDRNNAFADEISKQKP